MSQMTENDIIDKLSQVDIFRSSDKAVLGELAKVVKVQYIEGGKQVITKGEEGNCMYVMVRGRVKIHDGPHTIVELDGMQVFGELALINTEPRTASVSTLTESVLIRLDQDDFYDVVANNVEVMQAIIKMLTNRLRNQNDSIIENLKQREKELMKLVAERTADLEREKQKLQMAYEEISIKNQDLSAANEEIAEKPKNITASINYAKRIQDSLLPQVDYIKQGFEECFILFLPRDIVSGDCYWYGKKGEESIFAAIDCTGHGVPGALMSMIGNTLLNQIVNMRNVRQPSKILNMLHAGVRRALKQDDDESRNRDGMDCALINFNSETGLLQFAGANRHLTYVLPNGEFDLIKPNKMSIGGMQREEERLFTNHELVLEKGTKVYLDSDGYADQFGGPDNRKFMKRKMRNLILSIHDKPMEEQREILAKELFDWMDGYRQIDDILVAGFKL